MAQKVSNLLCPLCSHRLELLYLGAGAAGRSKREPVADPIYRYHCTGRKCDYAEDHADFVGREG